MQRIKQMPRCSIAALIVIMLGTGVMSAPQNVGAATYPCNGAGLLNALNAGGNAVFSCTAPTTVAPFSWIVTKNVALDGAGFLTISGNVNYEPVFTVNSGVNFTVQGLTISGGNTLEGAGSGIVNDGGTVAVINSTISNNVAQSTGGGLYNSNGTMTVTNSSIIGNQGFFTGGGIVNAGGTMTITNSTFSGNFAGFGMGGAVLNNSGTVTITDSTLSGNSAASGSGGINAGGTVNVTDSLIVNNTPSDVSGILATNSHNLTGSFTFADANNTPANHGGPTVTLALPSGSPAIDAGICNPTYTDPITHAIVTVTTDQRGVTRPKGGGCDIGAFEVLPAATLAPTTYMVSTAGGQVTLMGTNLESITAVSVGGAAVSGTVSNGGGTQLSVPIPPEPAGTTLAVVVTNPGTAGASGMLVYMTPNVAPMPPHPNGPINPMPPAPQPNPKTIIAPALQPSPNAQPMRH